MLPLTIVQSGFFTERNPEIVRKNLAWSSSNNLKKMGPFLAIPYFTCDGQQSDYTRYKPDHPRLSAETGKDKEKQNPKKVKYEAPVGRPTRPYFPPSAIQAICDPSVPLLITEGEKKALKASQEGFPCIGLPGVTNWSAPRKQQDTSKQKDVPKKDRELNTFLAAIPWQGRQVYIIYDTDDSRNPNVSREAAELARVLEKHGAMSHIVTLPPLWDSEKKCYVKQGLDDYLLLHSGNDLGQMICDQTTTKPTVSLDQFRSLIYDQYEQMQYDGSYHVSTAPTGTGKTYLDVKRCRYETTSMILTPTHAQIKEIVEMGYQMHVSIDTYPARCSANCHMYEITEEVKKAGFNPNEVVCPICVKIRKARAKKKQKPFTLCEYKKSILETNNSPRVAATHSRHSFIGESLLRKRRYIAVQENMVDVTASIHSIYIDFGEVDDFLNWVFNLHPDPYGKFVTSLSRAMSLIAMDCDVLGKSIGEVPVPRIKSINRVSHAIYYALDAYYAATSRRPIYIADETDVPKKVSPQKTASAENDSARSKRHRQPEQCFPMWSAFMDANYDYEQGPPKSLLHNFGSTFVRFLHHMMLGRISRMYAIRIGVTDDVCQGAIVTYILKPEFPDDARIIFNDATCDLTAVPPEIRDRIVDITPDALPHRVHQVIQYPMDVSKQTPKWKVLSIVRALLGRFPKAKKIGIITHSDFTELLSEEGGLSKYEASRIAKVGHFFGTESRGSNTWKEECDALFVIGTPRLPEHCVMNRLLQLGNLDGARRDGRWSHDYWSGHTESGIRQTVRTKGYRDHAWQHAYRQLTRAELTQAIGRSRYHNNDGIPLTVVVSKEDLGLSLADDQLPMIQIKTIQCAAPIISALLGLDMQWPSGEKSAKTIKKSSLTTKKSISGYRKASPVSRGKQDIGLTAKSALNTIVFNNIKHFLPLSDQLVKKNNIERLCAPMTGEKLGEVLGKPARTIRQQLATLEAVSLVTRHGVRGGYYVTHQQVKTLTEAAETLLTPKDDKAKGSSGQSLSPLPTQPIPEIHRWSPDSDLPMKGNAYSLAFGVTGQGYMATVVCVAASDGEQAVIISPDDLPLLLDMYRDKTMILHGAASVITALRNTYGDLPDIYDLVEQGRIIDTEVGHRLDRLGNKGKADTEWASLYKCYRYYYLDDTKGYFSQSKIRPDGSVVTGYDAWGNAPATVPDDRLAYLVETANLVMYIHETQGECNQEDMESIQASPPFGYVSGDHTEAMRDRYGMWGQNITLKSSLICQEVTLNGIGIDVKHAEALRKRYQNELKKLYTQLRKYGYKTGPGSAEQLQMILRDIEEKSGVRFERNDKGNIKTSTDALGAYSDCSPFISLYLWAVQLRSRQSNYLAKMTRSRLHPTYNYLLQTGRVSNGGDLATQTIPAEGGIRECIIPAPGHVFIQMDVCQMELVMLAQALQSQFGYESPLANMINVGGDIHRKVAAMMYDKTEADVTDEERSHAKVLNFGIPGGMKTKGLCASAKKDFGMDLSEEDASQMRSQWLALFPEVRAFLAEHHCAQPGVLTLTGRYRAKTERTQNRNTIFQGLGADAMVLGIWNLLREGYKIVNLIHDEVLIEIPMCDDYADVVADIEGLIIDGMRQVVPDMDIRVKSVVSSCWSKKATKVYDKSRIVAWSLEEVGKE